MSGADERKRTTRPTRRSQRGAPARAVRGQIAPVDGAPAPGVLDAFGDADALQAVETALRAALAGVLAAAGGVGGGSGGGAAPPSLVCDPASHSAPRNRAA